MSMLVESYHDLAENMVLHVKVITHFKSVFSFQSSIDVSASVVLLLSTLTIKDPYQVRNTGVLASLECRLWNTEFLLWSLFIASTYHMIMMTVERYNHNASDLKISLRVIDTFFLIAVKVLDKFGECTKLGQLDSHQLI